MISVVTPTLNSERYIDLHMKCMSIQSANFEHVIMDGLSTDATLEIVKRYEKTYPVRYYSQKDKCMVDAVNQGFAKSKGDIMAWLSSDDLYTPWALGTVQAIFNANPHIMWLTGIPAYHLEGKSIGMCRPIPQIYFQWILKRGLYSSKYFGYLQLETIFWRKSLWEKAGGSQIFSTYTCAADFHLWKAFAKHAPLHTVCSVLGAFGYRNDQISKVMKSKYEAECGISGRGIISTKLRRAFNLLTSILFHGRVVRPREFDYK